MLIFDVTLRVDHILVDIGCLLILSVEVENLQRNYDIEMLMHIELFLVWSLTSIDYHRDSESQTIIDLTVKKHLSCLNLEVEWPDCLTILALRINIVALNFDIKTIEDDLSIFKI
jgi:hypothetical protein